MEEKKLKTTTKNKIVKSKKTTRKTTTPKPTEGKKKLTVKKAVPFKAPKVVVPTTITAEIEKTDFTKKEVKTKPVKEVPQLFNVIFSLALLTIVSFLIGFMIIHHYSSTITEVNNSVVSSSLIAPAELLKETFYTKAGKVTTSYTEDWEINTRSNNSIGFKLVNSNEAQITVKIENATTSTPLEWIKESPPNITSYDIIDTPDYLEKKSGVLLNGYNDNGQKVLAAYYLEKYYLVEVLMSYSSEVNNTEIQKDFETIVSNINIQ